MLECVFVCVCVSERECSSTYVCVRVWWREGARDSQVRRQLENWSLVMPQVRLHQKCETDEMNKRKKKKKRNSQIFNKKKLVCKFKVGVCNNFIIKNSMVVVVLCECLCASVCMCMCVPVCVCVCQCVYVCASVCMCICVCKCECVFVCDCVSVIKKQIFMKFE